MMTDQRSISALDVAERYALGDASDKELDAARDAAGAVAWAAGAAAGAAAWDAAGAAARDAQTNELRRVCAAIADRAAELLKEQAA